MTWDALATTVLETARAMNASGINRGSAGNVSARCPDRTDAFLITPTGMPYEVCRPEDMVALTIGGIQDDADKRLCLKRSTESDGHKGVPDTASDPTATPVRLAPFERRLPSSEWRFHHDIYRAFPQAQAIVHAHSSFATALACQGMAVPPFHYMVARFGGDSVRCARYATFGTQALSDVVVAALDERSACLMAHHGMVVYGSGLAQALALAVELETLCEQYWRTLQLGPATLLAADEMQRVQAKFSSYGQQDR